MANALNPVVITSIMAPAVGAVFTHGGGGGGGPTPSEFLMTQLPTPRPYSRVTKTGGGQGVGQGAVSVTLNVTKAGAVYARCRSVSDGTTVLQNSWVAANVTEGVGPVVIANIDARKEYFYLDLSPDGVAWQNGETAIQIGRGVGAAGQSQPVRMFAKVPAYPGTMASLGVDISPYGMVYAAVDDTSITIPTATWALPSDAGPYTSTFGAEFLRRQIDYHGVACFFVGYAKGDTTIADWGTGTAPRNRLLGILDDVGGFEAFIWWLGGSDAGAGTSAAAFKAGLTSIFNDITAHNPIWGNNYEKIVTVSATRLAAAPGTTAAVQTLRLAGDEWCTENNAMYSEAHDINLVDSVHQGQPGNIVVGYHYHRNLSSNDNGPILGAPTRASGSAVISIPVTQQPGATSIVVTGTPGNRFTVYPSGQTTGALTVSSVAWDAPTQSINLTLSAAPLDAQALDVYLFRHPDPSGTTAFANMLRDDRVADGVPVGRSVTPTTRGPVICPAPSVIPTVPGQMAAPTLSAGNQSIIVTRAADPSTGGSPITGYDLRDSQDGTSWTEASMTTQPQTIAGLTNGTSYQVQTRANNAIGNGPWGPSASATPQAASEFLATWAGTPGTNVTAYTANTGQSFVADQGTTLLGNNEVYASASPSTVRANYTPTANCYVKAPFRFVTKIAATANWLIGRATSTVRYQGGYQQAGTNGEGWYIGITSGSFTVLGFAAAVPAVGSTHDVRMEMVGSTIRLIVDGVEVISVTNAVISAAGNIGMRKSGSGNETLTTGIHIGTLEAGPL